MAARFKTKLYTFLNATPIALSDIMGEPNDTYVSSVTFRAAAGNAAAITWSAPAGTAGGYMATGEAATFDLASKFVQEVDRRILSTILHKFDGGPVGLATLAAAIGEDRGTLEEIYEPYLLQIGFLDRTPRGRRATRRAREHLGAEGHGPLF